MDAPRIIPPAARRILQAVLAAGLMCPALCQAAACPAPADPCNPTPADRFARHAGLRVPHSVRSPFDPVEDQDDEPQIDEARLEQFRVLLVLGSTALHVTNKLTPKQQKMTVGIPTNTPTPLVVRPPSPLTAMEEFPSPVLTEIPPTQQTPEPGSIVSGLVGSALAVAAWLRNRRLLRSRKPTLEPDVQGTEGTAELQPS